MRLKVCPSKISGSITIPPSKSHTMRALLLGGMAQGKSRISNALNSPDVEAMLVALQAMGAGIERSGPNVEIMGLGGSVEGVRSIIHAGNSGQVARFCAAFAALAPTYTLLTGDASIQQKRPMEPLLSALNQLQGAATSLGGPLLIRGPIFPGKAYLSGEDSQPVSALLMATSFLQGTTELIVENSSEKPWIDLTLYWLRKLGGKVEHQNYAHYRVSGPLAYDGFSYAVPGDFSSAAFPLAAAMVTGGSVRVNNLDVTDIQGDKKILSLLTEMGASIENEASSVTLIAPKVFQGIVVNGGEIIDAVPILAVMGCLAQTPLEIRNIAIARRKESDRLSCITAELRKMGALIEEREDSLTIYPSTLKGASLFSHHDHRIAMALIVAALQAQGESHIADVECIAKSYPNLIPDFQALGANICLI